MTDYIAFYDDACGLCNYSIRFLLSHDHHKRVYVAPLSGITAKKELNAWRESYPAVDSIVLLTIYPSGKREIFIWSQAVLKLLWIIGGSWATIGLLSFLPKPLLFPGDLIYQAIAKRRRGLCSLTEVIQWKDDRFLP